MGACHQATCLSCRSASAVWAPSAASSTGVIRVVSEGAAINGVNTFNETCSPDNPLYFGKGPQRQIANSTHRRRFQETALPLHAALYIMGPARERQDVVAAEIASDKSAPMFLISTGTEKQVSRGYAFQVWLWAILGLVLAVGGAAGAELLQANGTITSWRPLAVAAGAFLGALALGWVWTVYNSLINLHQRVDQGWSQLDIQFKRRHDLIPKLEEAIKGYRAHESETLRLVAELRAQAEATPPGVAGPDYRGMAPLLRAVFERYPELKASEAFLRFQQELVDTEQRIALARDYFNEIATFYNIRLKIIPERYVAALARLRLRTLMSASDFERAEVRVRLAA